MAGARVVGHHQLGVHAQRQIPLRFKPDNVIVAQVQLNRIAQAIHDLIVQVEECIVVHLQLKDLQQPEGVEADSGDAVVAEVERVDLRQRQQHPKQLRQGVVREIEGGEDGAAANGAARVVAEHSQAVEAEIERQILSLPAAAVEGAGRQRRQPRVVRDGEPLQLRQGAERRKVRRLPLTQRDVEQHQRRRVGRHGTWQPPQRHILTDPACDAGQCLRVRLGRAKERQSACLHAERIGQPAGARQPRLRCVDAARWWELRGR